VTHSKWIDGVTDKSVVVESGSSLKEVGTSRHAHSKKKKRHKQDDVCSDIDKVRVKHKR
jgi:hypothetical protein